MAKSFSRPRYVEEHPYKITIRQLRDIGLFQPGRMTVAHFWNGYFKCEVDLRGEPILVCSFFGPNGRKDVLQLIQLVKRQVGRGERWFFKEGGTNILCETMYFYGRFISRQTARLPYRSQGASKIQRLVRKAEKLQTKILGTGERGPARGRSRISKLAELDETTKVIRQFQRVLNYEQKRTRLR